MRVLFDVNVPVKLRRQLPGHFIVTAREMGWLVTPDKLLLLFAEKHDFACLITADQGIPYQQRLEGRRISLVILDTNDWGVIREQVELIAAALDAAQPGKLQVVSFRKLDHSL